MSNNQIKFKQTEIGEIPENWEVVEYGDIAKLSKNTFNPSKEINEKYLGLEHLNQGGFSINSIGNSNNINSLKFKFETNDILFGKLRPYFKKIYKPNFSGVCSTDIWVIKSKNDSKIDQTFLYYLTASEDFVKKTIESSEGTRMPRASWNFISKQKFILPPIEEQKQIASTLSSLDDKIELNQKTIKTLEEVGQLLFKRWFVDFEFPNENGQPYKSSGGEMMDSDFGEIPKDWKIDVLPNFVNIKKGLSYKGVNLKDDGDTVLVGLKCFKRGGGFNIDGIKYYDGDFKVEHLLKPGDLIVAMTDLTQGAEVLGKAALIPNISGVKNIIASLDTSILKPKDNNFSKEYLYLLFSRPETQSLLFGYSNGSTVLHLSPKGLIDLPIIVPQSEVLNKFNIITKSLFTQIDVNNREIDTLVIIKNFLLSKLLSGKIRE